MTTKPSSLRAENISVSYRSDDQITSAIQGLDLDVAPGEFVSVVGPSGCGKSTLLMALDGLIPIDSGAIYVAGKKASAPGPDRAVVFQESCLLPWRTVIQNVRYGLDMTKVGSKAERNDIARRHVSLVGLEGFEDYYPHQLSGGMQQRVNIARALALRPEVLLLDEPFAALDAQTRETMQAELLRIWETHKITALFITHQIDEALFLSDRVVVLSQRPAKAILDIQVPFGRPRPLEIKRTDKFHDLENEIWQLLSQSTAESHAEVAESRRGA
ncbi:ABC transporter ATP-binding protein [Streptosporangium sp. NPDC006930]|uniref:ABC transporter ATP-binding protein n=1 Tax=unclassified Streptosporangium TaxID=2632669 RepID=UPI00343A412B